MTATATPLRWSSARDCPRKAALQASHEPDRDWSDREERILYRGRSIGRDYADWLAAKYGEDAILREVKIEWALGTGHMDVFLQPTSTAIEVLSSKNASDAMVHSKLVQLVGYMEHYPAASGGLLVVLDPSDFSEERFPVARDSEAYAALVDEVRDRIAVLERWRETGEFPARVCRNPAESLGHFCRHASTCFDGWREPKAETLTDDPGAIRLASALHAAKREERAAQAVLAEAATLRKQAEAELVEVLDGEEPGPGGALVGPFLVKRTHVCRQPFLDVKKAELAGMLSREALAEFFRPGAEYWTTAIEKVELDQPVRADGGDDGAPWTDEDLGPA